MMQTYRCTASLVDDTGHEVIRELVFRPFPEIPKSVMGIADPEDRMWAAFEWALPAEDVQFLERLGWVEVDRILLAWTNHGVQSVREIGIQRTGGTRRRTRRKKR